jgi:hypothetical protein
MPKDSNVNAIFHSKGVRSDKIELVVMTKADFYKILDPSKINKSQLRDTLQAIIDQIDATNTYKRVPSMSERDKIQNQNNAITSDEEQNEL